MRFLQKKRNKINDTNTFIKCRTINAQILESRVIKTDTQLYFDDSILNVTINDGLILIVKVNEERNEK